MNNSHKSVLINEVVSAFDYLKDVQQGFFVDGTIGLAGHSIALMQNLNKNVKINFIAIDKDNKALIIAKDKITKNGILDKLILVNDDFSNIKDICSNLQISNICGMLLDLGVSSMQLDDKTRGFSFSVLSAPLDMRMDQHQDLSAADILNTYSQHKLEEILKNGEEKHYRKVATAICISRKIKVFKTIGDLLDVLDKSLPKKYRKTHMATDTFRALRIEVNNELSKLSCTLEDIIDLLEPKTKLAVITFHSLEDRIVKNTFKKLEKPCTCPPKIPYCVCGKIPKLKIITKKPIIPSDSEIKNNPRARSAKLRIVEKI
jgi:16S rRNA (cytosine1402-N4)-methyltransferase